MANTMELKRAGIGNRDKSLINRMPLSENIIVKCDSGNEYEILHDALIGVGGEALVYKAKELTSGKIVVVKLYDQFYDTMANRANRQKIIEFLRVYGTTDNHIMPLLDFGYIELKSIDESLYKRPFDVLPLCLSNVSKLKLSYNVIKKQFLPAILKAVNTFHANGIVHRDIKPENIYISDDGKWVLGDFGLAMSLAEEDIGINKTSMRRGSIGYAPPELAQGFASVSSDFFSLGMTLATLYCGKHVYQELLEAGMETDMFIAISKHGVPINCPKEEEDLQWLISGLTCYDINYRAGYKDIISWHLEPKRFTDKYVYGKGSDSAKQFSYNFEGRDYHNRSELVNAMVHNWDAAKGYLYRGGVNNSSLLQLFARIDATTHAKLCEILEASDTGENYDLGLAKALYYIDKNTPFLWKGQTFERLRDIANAIFQGNIDSEITRNMFSSGYLSWRIENMANGSAMNGKDILNNVERMAKEYPVFSHYYAMYTFTPATDRNIRSYMGEKSVDEVFKLLTTDKKNLVYGDKKPFIYDHKVHAFLASEGFAVNIFNYMKSIKGSIEDDVEKAFRLWEEICRDKVTVRKYYMAYGPHGWMWWVKTHLSIYNFKSSRAENLRGKINAVTISEDMSIEEQSKRFLKLHELMNEFISKLDNDEFMTFIGIKNELKEITATNMDGFFTEMTGTDEVNVPMGYLRFIESEKSV